MTDIYGISHHDREAAAADLDNPAERAAAIRDLELRAVERVLVDAPPPYFPNPERSPSGPVETGIR